MWFERSFFKGRSFFGNQLRNLLKFEAFHYFYNRKSNMTKEELRDYLDVDSLEFLSVENLIKILGSSDHCFGCFTEKYPVPKGDE